MKKRALILHPFLFALFPVLFLYSYNIKQLLFNEIFLPSAIILGFTAIAVPVLWLALKKDSKKAGIIITVFLAFFFSYGRIYEVIEGWHIGPLVIGRHRYFVIIWAVLFILIAYFLIRTKKDLYNITNIINVIAVILVLIPLITIGIFKVRTKDIGRSAGVNVQEEYIESDSLNDLPDIYYIVLDGYASTSTLKEYYNYDNTEFVDHLEDRGFFVADESISNYPTSYLSLSSSLNMEYINYLADIAGIESDDTTYLYNMIENNEVMNFLKSRGYEYVHFSSGWGPTNYNRYADVNVAVSNSRWSEFQTMLIKTTMIDAFEKKFFKDIGRRRIINAFDGLAEAYKFEGSNFIFAHIISPHPPYLFDEDGKSVPEANFDMNEWGFEQKEYYLNQLAYINKKVEALVDEILANSDIAPVIILQSDHGPHNTFIEGRHPTDDMFKEGMRIFNAYYLPSQDYDLFYDSMTPVNSFRIIFNYYFGTDLESLSDTGYHSFEIEPYRFTDITDKVDYHLK